MSYPVADNDTTEIADTSGSQFDVKKFIFKLIGFLPWIIISTLISYSIASLYLRYTAQVHKISAQLLIKDNEQSSPDYNIVRELGVMPDSKEIQDQIDIIQSYALSRNVVDSLHLQFQIIAEGRIASSPLYGQKDPVFIHIVAPDTAAYKPASFRFQVLNDKFSTKQGSEKPIFHNYGDTFFLEGHQMYLLRNIAIATTNKGYDLVINNTRSVANAVRATISVQKLHDMSGILEISTTDEVPERGADIINKLIESFNSVSLTEKSIVANKTNKFLNDRIDTVEKELNALEATSGEYKRENKIIDVSTASQEYLASSTTYDNQRVEQLQQIQLLDGLASYIQNAKKTTDILPSNNGITDPSLQKLIGTYNDAVLNYNTQTKISTEKDPNLARLRGELNELKASLLKNLQSIKLGFQTRLDQINTRYNYFNDLLSSLPEKERELVNLKRQIGVKEQLYLFLLQKKADAELSLAVVTNDSRVVDTAHDQGVILPKSSQIKMFSYLIGILLPIVVMLLVDFFNNKLSDRREVEEGTRAPLLGELSYNKKQKNVIINPKSRSAIAEQFRLIRTNLKFLVNDNSAKIILVTSFMSGEGKSFVSLNLASSLATGGKKILLLELDLRKPKLAKYLNIKTSLGLTDYLVNFIEFDKIITVIPGVENVDVITSGPIPPNPTELIMSDGLKNLLEYAKGRYDYIVIDSSPVGLVADAFIIGDRVDVTLFILRHKYSYKTSIKYVEKLYSEKKMNRLSVVINGIVSSSGLGYGYGYGYGYSYGYGYHYGSGYYTDDNKKGVKGWIEKVFGK